MRADDAVATVEILLAKKESLELETGFYRPLACSYIIVHVHGATFTTSTTRTSAGQLGEDTLQGDTANVGPTMGAICRYDGVGFAA